MTQFDLIAVLIVLVALFSYLNFRVLRLPPTVGLMAASLLFSIGLAAVGSFVPPVAQWASMLVHRIDLNEALLHGMLGFLLFAGALHVDLGSLNQHKGPVFALATVGVLISTALVGGLVLLVSWFLGLGLRPIDCFLFGALISPTDPIAVMAMLKQVGAPEPLKIQIAGESLFNDGVGVVLFLGLLGYAGAGHDSGAKDIAWLSLREVGGGAAFGLAIGLLVFLLLRSVDNYQVEILLSLALVAGGYAGAEALHLSAPIAMVVAGLLIGKHGRSLAMSSTTTERLDQFWELVDEFLNATLFVLIGLEVLVLDLSPVFVLAGVLAVPVVLLARWVSVALLIRLMGRWGHFQPASIAVLTWGGLRGGISVALALSLPSSPTPSGAPVRDVLLTVTYVVVAFSILVQGISIGPLTRRWLARPA
ncbi:MAG: sodium:proton antiporter [Isosphaeraceae bacterium]